MWRTAFTSFVSAVVGGLLVFFATTAIHLQETQTVDTSPLARIENNQKAATDGFSARDIYKQFGSGVVHIKSIFTQERTDFFGFRLPPKQQQAGGSGFIVDKTGIIVTNAHVVQDSNTMASSITVVLSDNEEVVAKLLGTDPSTDIAVLKIDPGKRNLQVLRLGNSSKLQVGDTVYAIGSPFELEGTLTEGIVSALNRTIDSPSNFVIRGVIQTDAAVNPGNSGGPLIDSAGEVIGINSQIATNSGSFAGIAFAIPSDTVKVIVSQIEKAGKAQHAWLGIGGLELTKELADVTHLPVDKGVLIEQVVQGSPADKAGLKGATQTLVDNNTGEQIGIGGDVVTKIDNRNVSAMDDILGTVEKHKIGESLKLEIFRGSKKMNITVKLGERPLNSSS